MRTCARLSALRRPANVCEGSAAHGRCRAGIADFRSPSQSAIRAADRGSMRVFAGFADFAGVPVDVRKRCAPRFGGRGLDGCRHRALSRPPRPTAALGVGRARGREAGRSAGEARPRSRRARELHRLPALPTGPLRQPQARRIVRARSWPRLGGDAATVPRISTCEVTTW